MMEEKFVLSQIENLRKFEFYDKELSNPKSEIFLSNT